VGGSAMLGDPLDSFVPWFCRTGLSAKKLFSLLLGGHVGQQKIAAGGITVGSMLSLPPARNRAGSGSNEHCIGG